MPRRQAVNGLSLSIRGEKIFALVPAYICRRSVNERGWDPPFVGGKKKGDRRLTRRRLTGIGWSTVPSACSAGDKQRRSSDGEQQLRSEAAKKQPGKISKHEQADFHGKMTPTDARSGPTWVDPDHHPQPPPSTDTMVSDTYVLLPE